MVAPVLKHTKKQYLVKELLNRPAYRNLGSAPQALLTTVLSVPAALAYWILKAHPELSEKPSLKVVILNAFSDVSLDDGAWLSLTPWLMDKPDLKIEFTLVGDNLVYSDPIGERPVPKTAFGTVQTPNAKNSTVLTAARMRNMTGKDFFNTDEGKESFDIVFILSADMEASGWYHGLLSDICATRAIVGITMGSVEESVTAAHFAEAHGFSPLYTGLINPFWSEDDMSTASSRVVWELEPVTPEETMGFDDDAVNAFSDYQRLRQKCERLMDSDIADNTGMLVHNVRDKTTGQVIAEAIALPDEGLVVDGSGTVRMVSEQCYADFLVGHVLDENVMARYPRYDAYAFAHVQWAVEVYLEAQNLTTSVENRFGDLGTALLKSLVTAFKPAIDDGPSGPAWHTVLTQLGWELTALNQDLDAEGPKFSAISATGEQIPVYCENYRCSTESTEENPFAAVTKRAIQKLHTKALLLFRSITMMEKEGHSFSLAGLIYQDGKWASFAVTPEQPGLDSIFAQRASGFNIYRPDPQYADDNQKVSDLFDDFLNKDEGDTED